MVFLIKAGILSGMFYIPAAGMFLTAGLMAAWPRFAITMFGVSSGLGFFVPGLMYHVRRARSSRAIGANRVSTSRRAARMMSSATPPPGLSRLCRGLHENLARKPRARRPYRKTIEPLTKAEIHQQVLASSLLSQLPDPSQDIDDDGPDDLPVPIKGEPLSETIIRDRR